MSATLLTAALLAAVAALAWASPRGAPRRLHAVLAREVTGSASSGTRPAAARAGRPSGTAFLSWLPWRRRAARVRAAQVSRDLPVTADLLAACFQAGADPPTAVTVVAASVGGPVGDELEGVASLLALGADPAQAWGQPAPPAELAPIAAAVVRAVDTGAPLAETLTALAHDLRHARRVQAQAAAHRAGVYAVAPLGLCFLPAFVLLGVVPVVVGIAAPVLGMVVQ